jgi:hypothetical protein
MASPHTRFHENLQIGSKVISGVHTDKTDGQTHTQTGDLKSLLSKSESENAAFK